MKENLKVVEHTSQVRLEELLTPINTFVHFYLKHYRTIQFYSYCKYFYGNLSSFLSEDPDSERILRFAGGRREWEKEINDRSRNFRNLETLSPTNELLYSIIAEKMLSLLEIVETNTNR